MKLPKGEEFDYHFCVVRRLSALLRKCEGKDKKVVAPIAQLGFTIRLETFLRRRESLEKE